MEAELHDAVDTLSRAIGALEREMAKNPALVQSADTKDTQALMKALDTFVSVAGVGSSDKEKLLTLVQSQQTGTDDDDEVGAPQAAGYKSQSGTIIDILIAAGSSSRPLSASHFPKAEALPRTMVAARIVGVYRYKRPPAACKGVHFTYPSVYASMYCSGLLICFVYLLA